MAATWSAILTAFHKATVLKFVTEFMLRVLYNEEIFTGEPRSQNDGADSQVRNPIENIVR